jgi:hypothetical protein
MALVVEGLRHLVEVLARLRMPVPEGVLPRKVEDLGKDGEALARVCEGREELLRQRRMHREGWGARRVQ